MISSRPKRLNHGRKQEKNIQRSQGLRETGESNAAISLHGIFIFSRVTNVWSTAPYQRHKAPKKFQNPDFPLPGEKGTQ
jgi:hypothetical protein